MDKLDGQMLEPREVPLGGPRAMLVRRTLPSRARSTVGAWCFADSYGPDDITGRVGMAVPPHPHIGLQTVTWLLDGEVRHRDGLGNDQLIRPGQLNLMTAGRGIAHAEHSPSGHSARLHGVQLWIALPDAARDIQPRFEHHATLPGDESITVLIGQLAGGVSPARTHSPLLGAEIMVSAGKPVRIPLEPEFEHAVLAAAQPVCVDGAPVPVGALRCLPPGRRELVIDAESTTRALLIGGQPFTEPVLMWWNFVARDHSEIVAARKDWEAARAEGPSARFAAVAAEAGAALPAPALPTVRLRPRPAPRS
ncbi:MAG TPA: pirin family protein [Pseudonocardiaceae bacterium]|jgi:hypothetical protein|nr:pirin family protein [Pseudonocardiaceae bacterium]